VVGTGAVVVVATVVEGGGVVVVVVVDVIVVEVTDVIVERAADVVAVRFGVEEHATNASRTATPDARRARERSTASYASDQMRARSSDLLALLVAAALCTGCGASAHRTRSTGSTVAVTTTVPTTSTTVAPTTPTSTVPVSTTVATAPITSPTITPPTPAPTPTTPPLLVTRLNGVGDAGQVIAVAAAGYGANTATFTAYQRTSTGWQQVFGPWLAHVGRNGFAPSGAKREGDGRTPSGSYGLSFFFGVRRNPGVRFPYRDVTGPWIVWDDDASSANYNEWIDTRTQSAGTDPEPMHVPGVYDYGAVIAYNTSRTPGLGSAIFLHVSSGGSTAGCVSLPTSELLAVLRWLDPGRSPRIVMGTTTAITS
jgi:L,D-peptidoglycan transpeptidase YkuD (ErfK/YbiS/YcfS/YnhG family)